LAVVRTELHIHWQLMVSSVLRKRTEVTEDRSDQGPKWPYTAYTK